MKFLAEVQKWMVWQYHHGWLGCIVSSQCARVSASSYGSKYLSWELDCDSSWCRDPYVYMDVDFDFGVINIQHTLTSASITSCVQKIVDR